jgi:hypothetical protein
MIRLPKIYLTAVAPRKPVDQALEYDHFARTALETYRNSYNPLPTASQAEFGKFFSEANYRYLYSEVKRQTGYEPDEGELYESMMYAWQMDPPRSDETDIERRTTFTPRVTASYVKEMNARVLEKVTEETTQANNLWAHYAKYRNGPVDLGDDEDMHFGVDSRTKFRGDMYDMTWMMP